MLSAFSRHDIPPLYEKGYGTTIALEGIISCSVFHFHEDGLIFRFHELRHTFASIAITNGADVASVSEKLGHSDKAVTLRMYTHADQESMKRASQIFRNALKKAGQE